MSGSLGGNSTPYAGSSSSPIAYSAHGAITSMLLGNTGISETTHYNSRLQPDNIQAGSLMTLAYTYSSTNNNGNVLSQQITRPSWSATQSYSYGDGTNRLTAAGQTGSGNWSDTYAYDTVGNRAVSRSGTDAPALTAETPTALSWFNSQNRITSWGYDASGNILSEAAMSRTFATTPRTGRWPFARRRVTRPARTRPAADGRFIPTTATDGGWRNQASAGGTTVYVYDPQGRLAQEYAPSNSNTGTEYLSATSGQHAAGDEFFRDKRATTTCPSARSCRLPARRVERYYAEVHLQRARPGERTRLLRSAVRVVVEGQIYPVPTPWYGWTRQRGDQKHRELFADFIANPQNLNRYAYVLNNPTGASDPSGPYTCKGTEVQCDQVEELLQEARHAQKDIVSRAAGAYGAAGVDNGVHVSLSQIHFPVRRFKPPRAMKKTAVGIRAEYPSCLAAASFLARALGLQAQI